MCADKSDTISSCPELSGSSAISSHLPYTTYNLRSTVWFTVYRSIFPARTPFVLKLGNSQIYQGLRNVV
jgi:hypothetical protein